MPLARLAELALHVRGFGRLAQSKAMKFPCLAPFWLTVSLGACVMGRPDDAYSPPARELPPEDDDADDDDEPVEDAGRAPRDAKVVPRPDTGPARPPSDGGGGPATRVDGEVPAPSGDALEALAGRYLMRMDLYSTVMTTRLPRLTLKNRVSNLLMVDLVVDGDGLVGTEIMCDQTYEHDCVLGCETWKTALDPAVVDDFFGDPKRAVTRPYTFNKATGELRGAETTMALGFDDREGQSALPRAGEVSDPRLWKISAGVGMYTRFDAAVLVAGRTTSVTCQVETVQRFPNSFAGKVAGSTPALAGAEYKLDASKSAGVVVRVRGMSSQCTAANFEGQQGEQETGSIVRFQRYDGEGCPGDFDKEFPPAAKFK
jgi:hypothetical protein